MDGLRTSRVLILENEPESAIRLLGALAREGIGAVYVRGDDQDEIDALRARPLQGIRVVFADIDLLEEGQTDVAAAGRTAAVLEQILASDSEPLVIVIWTQKTELADAFANVMTAGADGKLQPLILRKLAKDQDAEDPGTELLVEVLDALSDLDPLMLLWHWEQRVHDAATATTYAIAKLIDRPAVDDRWLRRLRAILGGIGQAAAGETAVDEESAFRAVLEALNPLHHDRLDALAREQNYGGDKAGILEALASDRALGGKALGAPVRRTLNRLFQYQPEPGATYGAPGSLYFRETWDPQHGFPVREFGGLGELGAIQRASLLRHLWEHWPEEHDAQMAILAVCPAILLEITPECDFSQGKAPQARLLAGLLVPADRSHELSGKEYVKKLRAATFQTHQGCSVSGDFVLALDALSVVTLPRPDLAKQVASYRLRGPALADVQSWFGRHALRPGHITMDGS